MRYILGLESSCDETAVALYDGQAHNIVSHQLHSQTDIHRPFGGVVPELASRDHIQKLLPLIQSALQEANLTPQQLDGIAYTRGPGLLGALLVSTVFAQTLSYSLQRPCLGIHHMEGHLLAPLLEPKTPTFPFLALLVSGGHTLIAKVTDLGIYDILGESIDDAAGEAFDKTAKLLGLGYPGGAALSALARFGRPNQFKFPRPMLNHPGFNFSMSGLKTAVMQTWLQSDQAEQTRADIAHAFEAAVIEILWVKCSRALDHTGLNQLVVAGGVSANQPLRTHFEAQMIHKQGHLFLPRLEYCTDNAAMIAYVGYERLRRGEQDPPGTRACARWSLQDLQIPTQSLNQSLN
jgi:N6-L-threonylcarbamoyladenine synthase